MNSPSDDIKRQAFFKVQDMQREACRLMTLFIIDDDISAFYQGIYENRQNLFDLFTALMCSLEPYIRFHADLEEISVQEEIQNLALSHENFTLDDALMYWDDLEKGRG